MGLQKAGHDWAASTHTQLLYKVALVSTVWQSESVICTRVTPPFWMCFPFRWPPCVISNCPACCVLWVPSVKPRTSPSEIPIFQGWIFSGFFLPLASPQRFYTVVLYILSKASNCLLWDGLFHTSYSWITKRRTLIIRIFEQGKAVICCSDVYRLFNPRQRTE